MSSLNWTKFFEKRPDLEPPGYRETVDRLYPPKEEEEQKDDCDIEF